VSTTTQRGLSVSREKQWRVKRGSLFSWLEKQNRTTNKKTPAGFSTRCKEFINHKKVPMRLCHKTPLKQRPVLE